MLSHGNTTIWVGNGPHPTDSMGFDSGLVGFIYDTAEARGSEEGEPGQMEQALRGEIAEFDSYLTGDIYQYHVTDPKTGEIVDSCGGLYGLEDIRAEARLAAETHTTGA
jgi:hypothetical protein